MSIKALVNIEHDYVKYKPGDLIKDITRKEAEELIYHQFAIKIDDKFKKDNVNLKEVFCRKYKMRKKRELEMHYCEF